MVVSSPSAKILAIDENIPGSRGTTAVGPRDPPYIFIIKDVGQPCDDGPLLLRLPTTVRCVHCLKVTGEVPTKPLTPSGGTDGRWRHIDGDGTTRNPRVLIKAP